MKQTRRAHRADFRPPGRLAGLGRGNHQSLCLAQSFVGVGWPAIGTVEPVATAAIAAKAAPTKAAPTKAAPTEAAPMKVAPTRGWPLVKVSPVGTAMATRPPPSPSSEAITEAGHPHVVLAVGTAFFGGVGEAGGQRLLCEEIHADRGSPGVAVAAGVDALHAGRAQVMDGGNADIGHDAVDPVADLYAEAQLFDAVLGAGRGDRGGIGELFHLFLGVDVAQLAAQLQVVEPPVAVQVGGGEVAREALVAGHGAVVTDIGVTVGIAERGIDAQYVADLITGIGRDHRRAAGESAVVEQGVELGAVATERDADDQVLVQAVVDAANGVGHVAAKTAFIEVVADIRTRSVEPHIQRPGRTSPGHAGLPDRDALPSSRHACIRQRGQYIADDQCLLNRGRTLDLRAGDHGGLRAVDIVPGDDADKKIDRILRCPRNEAPARSGSRYQFIDNY